MSDPVTSRANLLGLERPDLEAFVTGLGNKPFRARQLMSWLYKRAEGNFDAMTDLARDFRAQLAGVAEVRTPEIVSRHDSADGTRKWLLRADGAQAFEMVFIPETDRGTLCISSQVGCALDCAFCSTAQQGFNRNLSTAEIVGQVWLANRELGFEPGGERRITNVVFMGMGEPLANEPAVWSSIERLHDDIGISARHLTVSTVGIVPGIRTLSTRPLPVNLAVSLHAARDELRDELVPINKRYPLKELMDACRDYLRVKNRRISFEWALIAGVNDSARDASELAKLALSLRPTAHVNLIPLNPTPGFPTRGTDAAGVRRFADRLRDRGVNATVRRNRGTDIDAACGQLAAGQPVVLTARRNV